MQRRPVFLVGLMGSGKSHWGQRLATALQWPFHDLDAELEQSSGRSIPEWFEEDGEAAFRAAERAALERLLLQPVGVVALGGGTPCFFDNMALLNGRGTTIFLDVPPEVLAERLLHHTAQRPLLATTPPDRLLERLRLLLEARRSCYQQARHQLRWTGDATAFEAALLALAAG